MKANLCTRMMARAVIVGIMAVVLIGCRDPIKDPTVTGVTVSPDTASVVTGGTQSFSALVMGTGDPAQTVIWALSGNNSSGTTISDTGLLTVAAGETATSLTVTATSTVDASKYGTATVTVTGGTATVTTVTVNPATASVAKGGTQTFSAVVTGTGDPVQTVTWVVTGGITETTISAAGVLSVAAGETATSLTVTATSTVDTSKSGTATATVTVAYDFSGISYRDMVQTVSDSVTISGNTVYYSGSLPYETGVFIENRTVTLSPFKIAKYETTYELWYTVRQWATSNGYTFANPGREGKTGTDGAYPTAAKYEPVTTINWRDAIVWCNAYSQMSGKQPVYYYNSAVIKNSNDETACDSAVMDTAKNGYRLPTEAEWEYAARGGGTPSTTGSFAYTWAGTNDESSLGSYAWYSSNASTSTHPVGQKTANAQGLYDMSGNVFEWCWDWYDSIGTETVIDPTGPASGTYRVLRGGGWSILNASYCAVAFWHFNPPAYRGGDSGFRVVCP